LFLFYYLILFYFITLDINLNLFQFLLIILSAALIAPILYYPLSLWDPGIVLGLAATLWADYSWPRQRVLGEINLNPTQLFINKHGIGVYCKYLLRDA